MKWASLSLYAGILFRTGYLLPVLQVSTGS